MREPDLLPLVLIGTLLCTVFAFFLIGFLVVHKSRQARARRKLAAYENQLLQTRIEVQEASAKSISTELHDNIGGMLSHIKMQLQFLADGEDGEGTRPELAPLYNDLGNAIASLRNISHTLNGDMIGKIGLAAAIQKEVEGIRRNAITTELSIAEDVQLSPARELLLFRIIQEAVTNVVKHAGATKLQITLQCIGPDVQLAVIDNGRGISNSDAVATKGMGSMNMKERAKMLGGALLIESRQGGGTSIIVTLPLRTPDDQL